MKELVENKNKEHIIIYDIIKIIAVLLVLLGHATYMKIIVPYGGVTYQGIELSKLYVIFKDKITSIIYFFHIPLFAFVSGALFYKECSKENVKFEKICKKKFNRLIVPYIVYGITYNIVIKYIAKFYTLKNIPYAIIYEILLGENVIQHLWFLPTLFFITILFFVIYNGILNKDSKKLIIAILILSLFTNSIKIQFPGIKQLPLLFIFFSIGGLFEENRLKIEKYFRNRNLVICVILLAIMSIIYKLIKDIAIISSFIRCLMILFIIFGVCFLSYIIAKFSLITKSKLFELLNKYSFDIYILGDPLNYIVLYCVSAWGLTNMYSTALGTMILIFTRTVGILVVSIFFAIMIKKLKEFKYFNSILKAIIILSIVISTIIIIYNSLNEIKPQQVIYEVIEQNE